MNGMTFGSDVHGTLTRVRPESRSFYFSHRYRDKYIYFPPLGILLSYLLLRLLYVPPLLTSSQGTYAIMPTSTIATASSQLCCLLHSQANSSPEIRREPLP